MKIRITPFLIINPIVIVGATYAMINILTRDGMAAIMANLFLGLIVIGSLLLLIDRIIVKKANIWLLVTIEAFLLIVFFKVYEWLVYG